MSVENQSPGETVLIVEDDEAVRSYICFALGRLGYTTLEADDAESAFQFMGNKDIDLLLTDVVLPGGLNGSQVAEKFLGDAPGLKVLYMSGYTEEAILEQGHLSGRFELLTKPFRKEALAAKVRRVMDS